MKKNILIVEDSPDLQNLLSQLFQAEGYTVSKASNGLQALNHLKSSSELPSLILLDIMMPVMDGLEFRREQQKQPQFAKIPTIMMTADSNFQAKAKQLGIEDFVRKPIDDVDRLLELVEKYHYTEPPAPELI